MTAKEFQTYAKWCNDNYIFIYVVPVNNFLTYKIAIMKVSEETIGTKVYQDIKGAEHPAFEKIRELYKAHFLTLNKAAA